MVNLVIVLLMKNVRRKIKVKLLADDLEKWVIKSVRNWEIKR